MVGGHIVGQVQLAALIVAVGHQRGRPAHGVEEDVVLAYEVVAAAVRLLPELSPGLGVALLLRPLLGRREVADDVLEPDVDALVGAQLLGGHRDPPIEVAGNGAVAQTLVEHAQGEVHHVLAPVALPRDPVADPVGVGAQAEEVVLGLAVLGRGAAELAARIEEIDRVQGVIAALALVAASLFEAAMGAGALDIAVG